MIAMITLTIISVTFLKILSRLSILKEWRQVKSWLLNQQGIIYKNFVPSKIIISSKRELSSLIRGSNEPTILRPELLLAALIFIRYVFSDRIIIVFGTLLSKSCCKFRSLATFWINLCSWILYCLLKSGIYFFL